MRKALLAVLLALTVLSPLQLIASAEEEKGPCADEIQFIHYLDESVAVQEVKAGNLDLYFFRMPLELVPSAKEDPNVKVYESVGGSLSLLINPAPSSDTLNPFSIKEVRYAMNYLINRQLVINEILKGYGTPMFSAFSVFDPDYLVLIDTVESFGFNYNPQLAQNMISDALTANGAVKKDGKWFFNDKPIEIKFFIRSDDPRRNALGELVSSDLERAGFVVVKDVGDLNKAFTVVYGEDPKLQKWHLYTEGWGGRGGFVRYDSNIAAQMYAPWFTNMPGFQIPEFWNYENNELDELTQRIFIGNFTSRNERDQLLNHAVETGVKESVRIFIASLVDPYIASKDVDGLVNDFSAGITSRFTLINACAEDKNLKIGVKQIYQGAWNPIGGFRDVYASRIFGALNDPGVFRNPYTGDVIPIRTSYHVETAGPVGKIDVPQDAVKWDPVSEEWVNVGEGVNATSKVTFDLTYGNWHHEQKIDKNDVLYSIYFGFEWGTNEGDNDPTNDPEYTSQQEQIVPTLKGYRFLSDNKVESYFDFWHFDEGEIASYDSVWVVMPWEIMAAMEKIVVDGEAAYSKSAADSSKVDWLSLIISGNADKMKKALNQFKHDNYVPKMLKGSLNANYAATRYDAAINWIDEKKHAVISNGPFFLQSYNPEARTITIKAFRDNLYPYEIGKWSSFEHARVATISNVNAPLIITKDSDAAISGGVTLEGDPSKDMKLYYFLKNRDGNVVINGDVNPAADGKFQIDLSKDDTRNLAVGPYELKLLAISNFALKPDIYTTSIIGLAKPLSVPVGASSSASQPNSIISPSGCLIATAAFGSELSPQVQFLRNFRDDRILATAAGSSFMNVFNAWYYSFSPYIADYERTNMWFQQIVKTSIYPLIGILLMSETVYASFSGEYGSIIAGLTASTLIGAVYFTPFAMLIRKVKQFKLSLRVALIVFGIVSISLLVGISSNSILLLMASTAAMVLATLIYAALFVARVLEQYVIVRVRRISVDDFGKVQI